VVPANVYGYAALVAYSLHQPSAAPATGPLQNLVSPSFANPLVLLIVSMVIGALFGYASDQLAKVLPIKLPTRAAHA
jgi:tetrahydromethanopterin S-methyltransferase subunit C